MRKYQKRALNALTVIFNVLIRINLRVRKNTALYALFASLTDF